MFIIEAVSADLPEVARIEQSWDRRLLPPDAMSSTGAFNRVVGLEKLTALYQDKRNLVLIARPEQTNKPDTRPEIAGFLLAYCRDVALALHPDIETDYAPEHSVWHCPFIYIKSIAVVRPMLRRGIASELLAFAAAWSKTVGAQYLLARIAVQPENYGSLRLFSKVVGAAEIGRRFDTASGMDWGLFLAGL